MLLLYPLGLLALTAAGLVAYTHRFARRVEAALPARGRFMEVEGARLHYLEKGEGQPIVMIHGLAGQSGHFSHGVLERLAERYRVIVVDRPGCGYSTRRAGAGARLSVQAGAIAELIGRLELERPVVVGHSLGGGVALSLALDHPDRVGGLVLVAPLTHRQRGTPAPFRGLRVKSPLMRKLIAWTVATPSAVLRGKRTLDLVFGPERPPRDFALKGGALLGLRPESYENACADLLASTDDIPRMIDRYPTLRIPIGVIFGREDRVLDYRVHGEALASLVPDLELEVVEGGHMLPLTNPESVAALVRRIADRVEERGRATKTDVRIA